MGSGLDWMASRQFDRAAANHLGDANAVISWAWSARLTLQRARDRGIVPMLEECGSANEHQEQILKEEHEILGLPARVGVNEAVIENERRECELAERILCPSEYVAHSFQQYGVPRDRCLVIPYACNPRFRAKEPKKAATKLKVLYVGSIGPRKGAIYLLRALEKLSSETIECTMVGRVEPVFEPVFRSYRSKGRHVTAVPHDEMPGYFKEASVLVLPTLDEGMAYVIMEALASGTPVITTAHSGAVGTVVDGQNGFIVPIRDSESISSALTQLADDPERYESMSEEALRSARNWTWDDYVESLLASVSRLTG